MQLPSEILASLLLKQEKLTNEEHLLVLTGRIIIIEINYMNKHRNH